MDARTERPADLPEPAPLFREPVRFTKWPGLDEEEEEAERQGYFRQPRIPI